MNKPQVLVSVGTSCSESYRNALSAVGFDVTYGCFASDVGAFDAVVFSGGGDVNPALYGEERNGAEPPDMARDGAELALCRSALNKGVPILGICRGIQLVNVALGGTLIQHLPTAPTHTSCETGDNRHGVITERGLFRDLFGEHITVSSTHHEACAKLGSGLVLAAVSDDGVSEGWYHEALPVYGVQWHPERMVLNYHKPAYSDMMPLFRYFREKAQNLRAIPHKKTKKNCFVTERSYICDTIQA